MEIFHISAECYPCSKSGWFADVVGHCQNTRISHLARVVIPCYDTKFKRK
jgi:starch synthase